ncbi:hypothetical protein BT96DRAFT_925872 [Gymnopus androsaceus JB14]|uniref:Uncharacterized protein n=1 Tax=Gymnopus androsaceus JB14 TaxID=1447944 RepID=A0A6A4GYN7_9AGAR|nr:hypothetical protein BT96DRAFT_925872 [Gymnopus androsaceus JB14]
MEINRVTSCRKCTESHSWILWFARFSQRTNIYTRLTLHSIRVFFIASPSDVHISQSIPTLPPHSSFDI